MILFSLNKQNKYLVYLQCYQTLMTVSMKGQGVKPSGSMLSFQPMDLGLIPARGWV